MKIAIIGAGPAGITLAYHLRIKYPEAEIELFEAKQKASGQAECLQYDGQAFPLGTCFTKLGYSSIYRLAKELKVDIERCRPEMNFVEQGSTTKVAVKVRFAAVVEILVLFFKLFKTWIVWKFNRQDIAPTHPMNQWMFSDFLKQKNIKISTHLSKIATTGQLYGPPEQITTHNALLWYTPSLYLSTISYQYSVKVISKGYQDLFDKILAQAKANVRLNSPVRACVADNQKVRVLPFDETFDYCFVTVPLDKIATPLSPLIEAAGPFRAQYILSMHVQMDYFFEGNTYCFEACDYLSSIFDLPLGIKKQATDIKWALARIPENMAKMPKEQLCALVLKDITKISGVDNIAVKAFRCLRYNIHYAPQQLQHKLPQSITAMQGKHRIWYSGGTLSHWNVESINRFNQQLVNKLPF